MLDHGTVERRPRRMRHLRRAAVGLVLSLLVAGCTTMTDGQAAMSPPPPPERWRIDYATDTADATLFDVAAVAKDEGWAIGQVSTEFVLLHRHGGSWQQAPMPIPHSRDAGLFNIHLSGSAPDNVWLFAGTTPGDSEVPTARRWDGHQWLVIPVDFTVSDLAVVAPNDVWALDAGLVDGQYDARHWDGHSWTPYVLPIWAKALSASGPRDVWVVGSHDDPSDSTQSQPAVAHFDGRAWQTVPAPEDRFPTPEPHEQSELTRVVAISPNNAWAFGDHGSISDGDQSTSHDTVTVLHWDGLAWRKSSTPKFTVDIQPFPEMAATGDGAGGFVLGGYQHGAANGALRVIGYPAPPPATAHAQSPTGEFEVGDLQLVPGTREVWAAGYQGSGTSGRGIVASCVLNG
jgi:hypothetical protein